MLFQISELKNAQQQSTNVIVTHYCDNNVTNIGHYQVLHGRVCWESNGHGALSGDFVWDQLKNILQATSVRKQEINEKLQM